MGSPTSQLDTLEFISGKIQPFAKLTPDQWVELLEATLYEIGGQFEYLKVFGLSGLYQGAFQDSGLTELEKSAKYDLVLLTRHRNGRHFVLDRNKTWGWVTFTSDTVPLVVDNYSMELKTHELLPFLRADAEWTSDGMLGYELYAGIMRVIEDGIERMRDRLRALEDNLKNVRQKGMRVRALYEPHPPVKDPRTS